MLVFYAVWLHSWPHSDITPLSRSVTCTFLGSSFFLTAKDFLMGYQFFIGVCQLYSIAIVATCEDRIPHSISFSQKLRYVIYNAAEPQTSECCITYYTSDKLVINFSNTVLL